jgi:hypothetical protein
MRYLTFLATLFCSIALMGAPIFAKRRSQIGGVADTWKAWLCLGYS